MVVPWFHIAEVGTTGVSFAFLEVLCIPVEG